MKRQLTSALLHVLAGVMKDASLAFPELSGTLLKDFRRVTRYSQSRGLGFFTLDLPHLDSLLLSGLESGRLSLEGPLTQRFSKRIQVPRLFAGLWLRIFDKSSNLKLDVDINAIAFLRQLCCLGKKIEVDCSTQRQLARVKDYHDVEQELRSPTLPWNLDLPDWSHIEDLSFTDLHSTVGSSGKQCAGYGEQLSLFPEPLLPLDDRDRFILESFQKVSDLISQDLGHYDPLWYSTIRESSGRGIGFKHGPGAVADRLKPMFKSEFLNWPHKLEYKFRFFVSAFMPNDTRQDPRNHEVPGNLMMVPKSAKAPRLIASEPSQHQWCQQLTWAWLEDRIKHSYLGKFVSFRNQSLSGALVLQASLDRKLATVDLSDASDRLSCWTIERFFRKNLSVLSALHAARTRWIRDDISGPASSFIKLKKFASQGTATTFPVQSIVFLACALSASLGDSPITRSSLLRYVDRVRVYGDDIILPRHGYARLIRLMDLLQLKVNVAKSYADGHFRESCGTDGYMGYDVTPIKPKVIVADGPTSVVAVIDTTNNLFYKGFWNASQSLLRTIPPRILRGLRIVRKSDVGYLGIASFSGSDESHLRCRWNSSLQRSEVRTWQNIARAGNVYRGGYSSLLEHCSRPHSPSQARVVSQWGEARKSKLRLAWEPSISCYHGDTRLST